LLSRLERDGQMTALYDPGLTREDD
jgi:hypothetical protein